MTFLFRTKGEEERLPGTTFSSSRRHNSHPDALSRRAGVGQILIVEDDRDTREAISQILTEEGFKVAQAANGLEALRYLRQERNVGLILLDLMMPVMDGLQFRSLQARDPALASIPVIALTALDAPYPAELCDITVVRKPIDMARLLVLIHARANATLWRGA
ncbi:MAG TPA: response regulator [Candidatus Binataceae bacterium]|nr:response regulator [Candidatus Binataceae bacterium]